MKLSEDLFDDVVAIEIPAVELEQPIELEASEIAPDAPVVGDDMGIATMLNSLIKDEYEAIDGYNSFIATVSEIADRADMLEVVKHIASEEQKHIGELTELLKIVSPNTELQDEGREEAKQELGIEPELEISEPIIGADVWEALNNIKDEQLVIEGFNMEEIPNENN